MRRQGWRVLRTRHVEVFRRVEGWWRRRVRWRQTCNDRVEGRLSAPSGIKVVDEGIADSVRTRKHCRHTVYGMAAEHQPCRRAIHLSSALVQPQLCLHHALSLYCLLDTLAEDTTFLPHSAWCRSQEYYTVVPTTTATVPPLSSSRFGPATQLHTEVCFVVAEVS